MLVGSQTALISTLKKIGDRSLPLLSIRLIKLLLIKANSSNYCNLLSWEYDLVFQIVEVRIGHRQGALCRHMKFVGCPK